MSDLVPTLRRHRTPLLVVFDVAAWFTAYAFFVLVRYGFDVTAVPWSGVLLFSALSAGLYLLLGLAVRLHQGRAKLASFAEMLLLGVVAGTAGGVLFVVNLSPVLVPRSIPASATFGMLVLPAWGRAGWRWVRERDEKAMDHDGAVRAIVVGGGEGGRELVDSMLRDPRRRWRPVGILDDDPLLRHRRHRGIPVIGTTDQVGDTVSRTGATAIVIAIPSASSDFVQRVTQEGYDAGVQVKVLPSTTELLTEHVGIRDIRDVNLHDVLGRNQLDTDVDAIAGYLTGKRVLVTGAGGSIGSELCRQINRYGPAELMMLDRDESALHAVQLSLSGRALLDSDDVILCDIRDLAAVRAVFAARRPEVVFHAAALKHLPMLEQYPAEAVKTNVHGTRNVLRAADLAGVERFVNVSTDKAANPSSVLGYSKRIAERLTASHAGRARGSYLSVRFGNVLGSRGSVLTSFASQIAEGGPVTVTHPEVTRYFMTIEEACQLVVQAAAIGRPGEALVLDMGEPVRILDVAHQLISQSGRDVRIEFTGLRPGEKLHEELFADHEPRDVRPEHPMVSHVDVPVVGDQEVLDLPLAGERAVIVGAMAELCAAPDADPRDGRVLMPGRGPGRY